MQFNTVYVLCSLKEQMWCSRSEDAHVDKGRKNGIKMLSGCLFSFGHVALVLPDCE